MKTIRLLDHSMDSIFRQLTSQLEGKLTQEGGGYNLKIRDFDTQGIFTGSEFSDSISFIRCQISVKERFAMVLQPVQSSTSLYFIYCNRGKITHEIRDRGLYRPIYENQSVVISPGLSNIRLHFLEDYTQEILFIKMDPVHYLKNKSIDSEFNDCLTAIYKKLNKRDGNAHYGSLNLYVCDHFKELNELKHEGLLREVFLEGQLKLILAKLLKQCDNELFQSTKPYDLNSSDLRKVKQISDYIDQNYALPHTLKDLTEKFKISPSKLQKGFKILFNRTVSNYIKNLRVEIAEEMIKSRECTISEIVYEIGFTSRSYFSKIFKDKYHCSPKDYQDLIRSKRQCV